MIRPIFVLFAASLLSSAVMACSLPGRSPRTFAVTIKDDQTSISLRKGDFLIVSLEGNPTTGYQWQVVQLDTAILEQSGNPEFTPAAAGLGSGGVFTFRFHALKAGQTTLVMAYSRPFETATSPLQTFTLTVKVN